jgi:hypothetical protein
MYNKAGIVLILAILVGGCSRGPQRVSAPHVNPRSAANAAMELYDTNHDVKLSNEELAKCPGVLVNLDRYDANHDKSIDLEEFAQHLADLLKNGTGATQLACNITYDGRPLSGAKVVLEPEPYLGNEVQPAEGVTTSFGQAQVGMPPDKAPSALKAMKLIHYGTFKVRITHPTINLPPKYNTETTLGYETIPGQPFVTFALAAK